MLTKKITFNELYKKTKKMLTITVTCLNTQNIIYYNYKSFPNFIISKAIIMSMCVPILFKPIKDDNNNI